jgi:hypothetical protein
MSTTRSTSASGRIPSPGAFPELNLRNWPLGQNGWRSWLVVVGTAGMGLVAAGVSGSVAMGILSSGVLMLSMWRFWIPVRYYIRSRGIVEQSLGRRRLIPWHAIRQCRLRKQGVVLLLDDKQLLFDGLGAKYIEGQDQQQSLVAAINFYRQSDPRDELDPTDLT